MRFFFIRIAEGKKHQLISIPAGLNSKINQLIFAHLLFFLLYAIMGWIGLLEQPLADGTVADFVRTNLALSYRVEEMRAHWWISIFTFHFIHSNFLELVLSMGLLWLFGHILKEQIGEQKVVLFYFACAMLSGIVFMFSHFIFEIFSSGTGVMEGAFSGTLGIMTAALAFNRSSRLHIQGNRFIPLWYVFAFGIAISLMFFYQHNMAYILVFVGNLYAGYRYALYHLRPDAYELKLERNRIPVSGTRPITKHRAS